MTTTESALPPAAMSRDPSTATPDAQCCGSAADIAPDDWDLMFRSVLEVLAQRAVEKPATGVTGLQLQAPPGHVLAECLQALDRLRQAALRQDRDR